MYPEYYSNRHDTLACPSSTYTETLLERHILEQSFTFFNPFKIYKYLMIPEHMRMPSLNRFISFLFYHEYLLELFFFVCFFWAPGYIFHYLSHSNLYYFFFPSLAAIKMMETDQKPILREVVRNHKLAKTLKLLTKKRESKSNDLQSDSLFQPKILLVHIMYCLFLVEISW